jgi:hypothetical protein
MSLLLVSTTKLLPIKIQPKDSSRTTTRLVEIDEVERNKMPLRGEKRIAFKMFISLLLIYKYLPFAPPSLFTNHIYLISYPHHITTQNLSFEGERSANLVASLVELLGIEGSANAEGETLVDLGVVCEGEDTAVVDLGLFNSLALTPTKSKKNMNIPLRR